MPEAVLSRLPDQIHHCFHVGPAGDFPLGSIAGLAAAAEAAGCDTLCFIGAVDRRDFTDLDEGGRWVRDQAGADAGDSALLDALISFVEARGLAVVGVNTLCPVWLTPAGVLAGDGALVGEAFRTVGLARARALGLEASLAEYPMVRAYPRRHFGSAKTEYFLITFFLLSC